MAREIIVQGKEASLLELDLFLILRRGQLDSNALAGQLGLHPYRARELFDALAANGLLDRCGEEYRNVDEVDLRLVRYERGSRRRPGAILSGIVLVVLTFFVLQALIMPQPRTWFEQAGSRLSLLPHRTATQSAQLSDARDGNLSKESYALLVATPEDAAAVQAALAADPREGWSPAIVTVTSAEPEIALRATLKRQLLVWRDDEDDVPQIIDLRLH